MTHQASAEALIDQILSLPADAQDEIVNAIIDRLVADADIDRDDDREEVEATLGKS